MFVCPDGGDDRVVRAEAGRVNGVPVIFDNVSDFRGLNVAIPVIVAEFR
jgi:hypothetical protein